jgi:hypothetical protein
MHDVERDGMRGVVIETLEVRQSQMPAWVMPQAEPCHRLRTSGDEVGEIAFRPDANRHRELVVS